jgi:hypothetical protein
MPFLDNNIAVGLDQLSQFQVGRNDQDIDNQVFEQGLLLPWASDPAGSYVYYDCTVGAMLDSGIVVHNRLPQVDRTSDTLSSADIDDPNLDKITNLGVNLKCQDQYKDIVQRMGHSRYWFRLWGQALRVGYQIPIPGIKTIGGVKAIPYDKNPQWAFNRIAPGCNYGGVILWHAQWSLWYTTDTQPVNQKIPAVDLLAHTSGEVKPPSGVQASYTSPDDSAQSSLQGFFKKQQ